MDTQTLNGNHTGSHYRSQRARIIRVGKGKVREMGDKWLNVNFNFTFALSDSVSSHFCTLLDRFGMTGDRQNTG